MANLIALIAVPRTGLLDIAIVDTDVDNFTHAVDTLTVHDLELDLFERRRDLIFHHFHARLAAYHFVTFFHRADAAYIQTHRGVELQGVAASGGFWAAEHHTDLHADLVNKDNQAVGVFDVAG